MNTGRFETFADAILAIIMTVLIVKIPQPAEPTLFAIWDLRIMYVAYVISFLIIFNLWFHNHNLFQLVDNIDNLTIWLNGALLFSVSLLPYFTIWLANNINSVPAETMFGLIFIFSNIFTILSIYAVFRSDPYNIKLQVYENSIKWMFIPLFILFCGFILTYTVFVQGIFLACFISIVFYTIFARKDRVKSDVL